MLIHASGAPQNRVSLMQFKVGYELVYSFPQPTPLILVVNVHDSRRSDMVVADDPVSEPLLPIAAYRDAFGNQCHRVLAPRGRFRLSANGTTIAYSGDSGPSERLAELARASDLFVCEATLTHGDDDGLPRGHLSVEEALEAARQSGTRRVLLTHRPAELPVPDGVELAYDGLELEL